MIWTLDQVGHLAAAAESQQPERLLQRMRPVRPNPAPITASGARFLSRDPRSGPRPGRRRPGLWPLAIIAIILVVLWLSGNLVV